MDGMGFPLGKRVVNLMLSVRKIAFILPGDRVRVSGEKPALYVGAIEMGDSPVDYVQMHIFKLYDGQHVILVVPTLNRYLGKWLY